MCLKDDINDLTKLLKMFKLTNLNERSPRAIMRLARMTGVISFSNIVKISLKKRRILGILTYVRKYKVTSLRNPLSGWRISAGYP